MTNLFSPDPAEDAFLCFNKGNFSDAESGFRAILAAQPGQPDALHGMACLARARGQSATAIALLGRALQKAAVSPDRRARMHTTLGLALLDQGHPEAARAAFQVAVLLQPFDPNAHIGQAEALVALGRRGDAREALQKATDLLADESNVRTRLGELFLDDGLVMQAVEEFGRVVRDRPDDGAALANLGAALFAGNAFDEARDVLLRACELGAETAETLNSLGLVEMARGELAAASDTLWRALELRPSDARIANNLGTILMEIGRVEDAESLFQMIAVRESGEEAERARFNRSTVLLGQGRFAEGWRDFESRRSLLGPVSDNPQWDGSSGEAPVAVVGEQGLGDEVQFMRFLTQAARLRPLRLRFRTAVLAGLMHELDQERILPAEGPVAAEISLLSLPAVLGLEMPPAVEPYLVVGEKPEAGRIGLCWSGNPSYRFDRRRSVPVVCLEALRQISGMRFVALQPGDAPEWMERVPLETTEDLAQEVGRCALVISVDTLVAHMAGALGRPLWLLNREGGDWRWKDVNWYRDVRQFRPPAGAGITEGWSVVLQEVVEAFSLQGR
ncbi:tetratricopeptide repeat protein [Gluconobacter cerevisiae]|uniref:Tetratricopeptide repeat protein n=1 Tax=Gluconobacter cerevisiae TaxID=1379734 RepID=A0ABR9YBV2_9PROT|nr:tetratricopeptide repeat protein [Gluconobacter cerevisiae]MBF0876126.1 tetratricopeptide repeat protein [Gluconobacter cerevisiae]